MSVEYNRHKTRIATKLPHETDQHPWPIPGPYLAHPWHTHGSSVARLWLVCGSSSVLLATRCFNRSANQLYDKSIAWCTGDAKHGHTQWLRLLNRTWCADGKSGIENFRLLALCTLCTRSSPFLSLSRLLDHRNNTRARYITFAPRRIQPVSSPLVWLGWLIR